MATIRILSGGAAQAVVEAVAADFERTAGHRIEGEFSAVGAMKSKIIGGAPVDLAILTATLIDELAIGGHVVPGTRIDLGRVGTGVAVRAGTPLPDVSSEEALRGNLLAATVIACPDPAVATAGKIVEQMLERLGIAAEVKDRMRFFPNGYAAMRWLAGSRGTLEVGITQVTEILPNEGVAYAGPLPDEFQMKATYSVGLAMRAAHPGAAKEFAAALAAPAARRRLAAAGFELD